MTTIQHSSPLHFPSTPVASHQSRYPVLAPNFRPLNSSPLASPSSPKSPIVVAQARRRSQYKARTPSTPVASSSNILSARTIGSSGGSVFYSGSATSTPVQDPQKSFLREKFKAKCFARAAKAREKAIRGRRYDLSSDGFDDAMDDEDEEDDGDDSIMDDELFRRIMSNVSRNTRHSYRVSYALDVGSSFDPDIEDVNEWERELNSAHTYRRFAIDWCQYYG
ncbi:hypothetical protein BDZ94DRAFT_106062 [Collybia nuda]|uniref:Uncharacterized protein n=1 Tax=Collybia nuda TaxID=64659 RepID=A0A9P5XX34_9AGAR|nr:hypothetical protein BDZ94DRAFT_106062 [Collybia nuda]